jgi:hypothetical protein
MMTIAQPTDFISFVGFGSHAAQRPFAVYQLNGSFGGIQPRLSRPNVTARGYCEGWYFPKNQVLGIQLSRRPPIDP